MKINTETPENGITLPREKLLELLEEASECEIKTLILVYSGMFTENGAFSEKDAAEYLGNEEADVKNALQFWRGAGLIGKSKRKKTEVRTDAAPEKAAKDGRVQVKEIEIPQYSGIEIDRLFTENGELKSFIDACQNTAGKIFNTLELNKIISLYDYFRLPADFILMLFAYNASRGKTTVHYLEKTAIDLSEKDINTVEKLDEYIKQKEAYEGKTGKIREIFGIGQRALIKSEKDLIYKWTSEWDMPLDLINYAYELTVRRTGKASMSYAGTILEGWHRDGIRDVRAAEEATRKFKSGKNAENGKERENSTFDVDEFFEAALKKSYDRIGKK